MCWLPKITLGVWGLIKIVISETVKSVLYLQELEVNLFQDKLHQNAFSTETFQVVLEQI